MTTEKPASPEAPPNAPLAKVVCERGKFYVCKRKQYWDSEAKKSAEERSYIGRIVDGMYYSMVDYRWLTIAACSSAMARCVPSNGLKTARITVRLNLRQTLKMEREFSQNGTGPFWTTLWLRFG